MTKVVTTSIGFGPRVSGEAVILGKPGDAVDNYQLTREMEGKILIVLSPVAPEFLEKARFVGVAGVVLPSIHYRDYRQLRDEADFALLVLTKFGNLEIPDETARKLAKLAGETVALDGEGKTLEL